MAITTYCLIALLLFALIAAGAHVYNHLNCQRRASRRNMETFVHHWFAGICRHDEQSFFLQYLSPNVDIVLEQERSIGHSGFLHWYEQLKTEMPPGCAHQLESIHIRQRRPNRFEINLEVCFSKLLSDGSKTLFRTRENWQVKWDKHLQRPLTYRYQPLLINPIESQ